MILGLEFILSSPWPFSLLDVSLLMSISYRWRLILCTIVQNPDQPPFLGHLFPAQSHPPLPSPSSFHTTLFTISAARSIQIPCHVIASFCVVCFPLCASLYIFRRFEASPSFSSFSLGLSYLVGLALQQKTPVWCLVGLIILQNSCFFFCLGGFCGYYCPCPSPYFFILLYWFNFTSFLIHTPVLSEHWIVSLALCIFFIAGRNRIFV